MSAEKHENFQIKNESENERSKSFNCHGIKLRSLYRMNFHTKIQEILTLVLAAKLCENFLFIFCKWVTRILGMTFYP
ncbi:hypothetical protein Anas_10203 [Armadillidium nasatum]|uniref:Uncharacterized protein n=1 Tax=Armadillidium nasatum TaxID=96803 RepID=A0A5N5TBD1_9CRUS|nr:hypothetical protein Anas_10203 [Armadillidium nasatum]